MVWTFNRPQKKHRGTRIKSKNQKEIFALFQVSDSPERHAINQVVSDFFNTRNLGYLENSNITKIQLYRSNLLLNPNGTKLLVENMNFYINFRQVVSVIFHKYYK